MTIVCFATPANPTDSVKNIGKVWVKTVDANRYLYLNPDKISVGDPIPVCDSNGKLVATYVADSAFVNCQWAAAQKFILDKGKYVPVPSQDKSVTTKKSDFDVNVPWWNIIAWFIAVAIVLYILLLLTVFKKRQSKNAEPSLTWPSPVSPTTDTPIDTLNDEYTSPSNNNPILPGAPNWETATQEQINEAATTALNRCYRKFKIIGDVKRAVINGTCFVFTATGESFVETYQEEPGYVATLEFENGSVRVVPCRAACFNPLYNATDSLFEGTYTLIENDLQLPIPTMDTVDQSEVAVNIQDSAEEPESTDQPPAIEQPAAASDHIEQKQGYLHVTKISVRKEGEVLLEGDLEIDEKNIETVKSLIEMLKSK